MIIQKYAIPLKPCGAEVGGFVRLGDEIVGFVSGLMPDNCAAITLFEPKEMGDLEYGVVLSTQMTIEEVRLDICEAVRLNPNFREWVRTVLSI